MEKIFDPSIAFSGFIGALIISMFTGSFILANPFRFMISTEELKFMSSWSRLVRYIYLATIITVSCSFYSIIFTSIDKEYVHSWPHKIVANYINVYNYFLICFVLLVIILLVNLKWIQKKIRNWIYYKNEKNRTLISYFIMCTLIMLYCLFFLVLYGLIVNETLISGNHMGIPYAKSSELITKVHLYEKNILFRLLFFTALNYLLFYPVIKLIKFFYRSEIIVDVYCKDGNNFMEKYLVNTNVDGSLLMSESSNIFDSQKYLVPKDNISFIEFNTHYYIFAKKLKSSRPSSLVLPDDFSEEEKKIRTQ